MIEPNFKLLTTPLVEKNTAEIIIEPLPQNFGHTIGNALRRVLLGSLPGASATQVKIAGVNHPFSSIDGMKEDVLEFILNLKEVDFSIEEGPVSVKLNVAGPKEVTAADIDLPSGVTITNPEKVLAHLTAKDKLSAVITVESGIGYAAADEHVSEEVGVIPLDSSFSPVLKANYTVEATRVGRRTDFDKVRMTVTTDGSITPEEAVKESAKILTSFFTYVYAPTIVDVVETASKVVSSVEGYIEDLDLPTRIANALKKSGIAKLSDLERITLAELKKVKNLGEKSAEMIVEKAKSKGVNVA